MNAVETIAKGGQPEWRETFDHPDHGKLTFTVEHLPTVADWLAHAVAQERIAPGLASGTPAVLAAAVAAMQTFVHVPVLSEDREEDPDDPSHVRITRVFYDPLEDEHLDFVLLVYTTFFSWRSQLLSEGGKQEIKKSSGVTRSDGSADSLPATTESLPTTRA